MSWNHLPMNEVGSDAEFTDRLSISRRQTLLAGAGLLTAVALVPSGAT